VVAVTVTDQNEIGFDSIGTGTGGGIASKKWVNQNVVAAGFCAQRGMTKPGNFGRHGDLLKRIR
jgi:hypothetical protein